MDKPRFNPELKILCVDDQPLMRDMLKAILRGLGFLSVVALDNGLAAIQRISEETFDLIICDWNMPNGTGLEVLQHTRSLPRYKDTPFLMLTAEAYRENVLEASKAGVTAYIAKPFTSDTLAEKLDSVLNARGASR